jgi:phosphoribosylformylglycinamidine synthase
LAIALAEACIQGQLGAEIWLKPQPSGPPEQRWDQHLFGEGGARILVSVHPQDQSAWETHLTQQLGTPWEQIGVVHASPLGLVINLPQVSAVINATMESMTQAWTEAIAVQLEASPD